MLLLALAATAFFGLPTIRAAADDIFTFAFKVGLDTGAPEFPSPQRGDQPGQFVYPYDVEADSLGRFYVVDTYDDVVGNRVQVFNPDGTLFDVIAGPGDTNVQFSYPTGLAIDARDQLLVADMENHRIAVRLVGGAWSFFGTEGSDPGQFSYPFRVAVAPGTRVLDTPPDTTGRIAVVDNGNYRIQVFDAQFNHLFSLEGVGEHLSQFDSEGGPIGVAMDASGRIFVADPGNQRIAVYEPDPTANLADECVDPDNPNLPGSGAADGMCTTQPTDGPRFRTFAIGVTVSGDPQLLDPFSVKLDPAGRILTADGLRQRILRIEPGPSTLTDDCSVDANWVDGQCRVTTSTGVHLDALVIGGPLAPGGLPGGSGYGQFNSPLSVASDVLGRILVADTNNHRVQVFEPARLAVTGVTVTPGDDPLNAGDSVTVGVTVKNEGGATLSVLPDVVASGVPVVLTSPAPPAFSLGPGLPTTFSLVYKLNGNGTLTFDVGATGTASGRTVLAERQDTEPLTVLEAPEPRFSLLNVSVSPTLVAVGGTVTVQMQVNNIGNVDLVVTPSMTPSMTPPTPSLVSLLTTPGPATIPTGGSHDFQFTFKAEAIGSVSFTADATATSEEGDPPPVEPLTSSAVVIQEQEPDTNPPSITAVVSAAPSLEGWYAGTAIVTLIATDEEGPATLGYSVSGGDPSAGTGLASPTAVTITVNGTSTLTYWAVDAAGNESPLIIDPEPSVEPRRASLVVRIDKIAPVFTVTGPTRAPNAFGWYDSDVNVVFSASDAPSGPSLLFPVTPSFVTVTGEGVHNISSLATDKAGNTSTAAVTVIRLDKSAPNLFNVFDAESKDVNVYARDLISGSNTAPLESVVVPVSWGSKKPLPGHHDHEADCDHDDDDEEDSPKKNARAELRMFRTEDFAGNETVLVEKVQHSGKQAHVKVLSYQFITAAGEGPVIRPQHARKKYEWSLNRDGSFKHLNQHMTVGVGRDRVQVLARYDGRKNVTSIHVLGRRGRPLEVPGLVLLRMVTDQATGGLFIEFLDEVVGG